MISDRVRERARVLGTVQGVGFRPFVYRLAREHDLSGFVLNDERGVLIEVEGAPALVSQFMTRLRSEAPPLARIDAVSTERLDPNGACAFAIRTSARTGEADALIAADTATCEDCLAELFDPADRRYRYPFINCTNCGPRFTIVRGVPYDRELTTMSSFRMCAECHREYDDPADRRFHAQPNACPRCGPRVRLTDRHGRESDELDAIERAASCLADGAIVAVKGIGGFHLACDAENERAVATLRGRKHREAKPFAVMVADAAAADRLVELHAEERSLLCSVQRPIVLAPRRPHAPVATSVAPNSAELGVLLPYAPLHHLLLRDFAGCSKRSLVMTSGNRSDEPIAYRDADALDRLADVADLFLVHDRPIQTRTDDSVIRVITAGTRPRRLPLRRSRGYVPGHLDLPVPAPQPLLACGAQQKNTFCLAKGRRAWVSHHVGDLEHVATLCAFEDGIAQFERLFAVAPTVVAHDLHPGYLSTAYAFERDHVELVGVQHHHAHLAACLAEHGLEGPAVGAVFDGTGYGTDGTVWGGELLVGDLLRYERLGHLRQVRMPGGAAAIREPWRMADVWLAEAFGEAQPLPPQLAGDVDGRAWATIVRVAQNAALSPLMSSVGRLLDGVAALCGICPRISYEGQAAVELEAAAARAASSRPYEIELTDGLIIDPRGALRALARDLADGASVASVAAGFHAALADVTARACIACAARRDVGDVVLGGGVFQNRLLIESVATALERAGLRVLTPERLPPGDGGIAFGQAAIAAARTPSAARRRAGPASDRPG
jgi:hydrogenase maturation protein HypF